MTDVPKTPDIVLIRQYRERDSEALAKLMGRYLPLIHKLALQYQNALDFDDLVQEGCIGFLDAVRNFRLDSQTPFSAYAAVCVRNRIYKAVEKNTGGKSRVLSESVPFDDASVRPDCQTPEKICIDRETLQAVLKTIQTALSPLERQIFLASLAGQEYQSIADSLHIPPKSVDNALQRVRRKLKAIHRP